MSAASTTALLLKGLLTSPVNPASCSCARGLAVAITELAAAVPPLSGLASAATASVSASAPPVATAAGAAAAAGVPPSYATWGSSSAASSLRGTSSSAESSSSGISAVERLQAELKASPPPPLEELAADGMVGAREALWRRRMAFALDEEQ